MGVAPEKLPVFETLLEDHLGHAESQGAVGAGPRLEVDPGGFRQGGPSRIDDNGRDFRSVRYQVVAIVG